jgi:hypothetical protein
MNESIRTIIFVALGSVVALGAYITKPRLDNISVTEGPKEGSELFPTFKDPSVATSLEIKQFDEALAKVTPFIVSKQGGVWTLPSHGNYPADAESQLKAVAETFADLKILGVAAKDNKEHDLYGVNDPDKADVGTKGVGTLIAMQDDKGNDLLRMIVGKEVAGAANHRFVRKPSEDWVYVTTIDMSKLPTDFEKWIEKDLLKLSTFDVNRVVLKDYLILPTNRGAALQHRMDATLSYDSGRSPDQWKLEEMQIYRQGGQPVSSTLGSLEELNKQKLDDLRNALGDLKIVDVTRKPAGLGNSLKIAPDKLPSEDAVQLQQYGFFPNQRSDGALDIYGANGELVVDTKDGVEYLLRFGNIKSQVSSPTATKKADKDKADKDKKDKSATEDEVKVNRYLFVVAQLAPSILTPPIPEPEPAGPEQPKEEKKDADAKAADQKADEKAPTVDPQQAERERVRKENERKRNEYNDRRKKAETRVKELNDRFADWYYVVSEDVYKKLRLTRSDIVKESATAKDEGFGIDAFRKLEEEGLKQKP